MLKLDRYALECDLAETYHIFELEELPLKKVALFACGLRENSRIKLKMAGSPYSMELLFLASILDDLKMLLWSKTTDAKEGLNIPTSILSILLNKTENDESLYQRFDSPQSYEETRKRIIEGGA